MGVTIKKITTRIEQTGRGPSGGDWGQEGALYSTKKIAIRIEHGLAGRGLSGDSYDGDFPSPSLFLIKKKILIF